MKHTARLTPIRLISYLTVLMALTFYLALPALAALPPAGSVIGNQATATYTDASGQTKTATSNLVETIVQQVGSLTLIQDNTKTAAIGNTVYMPHTLTNTGNGSDSFVLSLADVAPSGFTATNIAIYLDANGDGVPDSTTPLATTIDGTFTTPSLPAGGTYNFVISMTVPGSATSGQSDAITVTATPNGTFSYTPATITNTDTLTVTAAAAFQVNKSIDVTQGPVGATRTYTLTYKNVGAAAGTLALQDVIGSGTTVGYEYVAGSAKWSAGNTTLTDTSTDETVSGMVNSYAVDSLTSPTTITATITNVGPNVTGTISFQVLVLNTAIVGSSTTTNTAMYGVNTATLYTNPSSYNVLASYSVVLNDGTSSADGNNLLPAIDVTDSPNVVDLSYIGAASPGQTISFNNYVWNTGNTADTFNVTTAALATNGTWPVGTTFQLYKSDGATPLMDTNGDGIADTGSLAAGASYVVILKVTLPAGACPAGVCSTGPFDVVKTAKSVGDPNKSNVTYDRLGSITAPAVDLANSTITNNLLVDADSVSALTTTNSVLPGGTTTFDLYILNEGLVADSYSLAYSGTNAFSPTTTLPAGWTVKFMDGATAITSVGPLAAGTQKMITAVVTVPANALAATTNVYFQAKSQATGANDAKWDAVQVTAVNSLTLAPSNSGQIEPGGTVVYPHTLSNTGNTTCTTDTFTFTISETLSAAGWTFVLYEDNNGDGMIDAGDTALTTNVLTYTDATGATTHLDPGEQVKVLVKVFAPAGAATATTDVVTITVAGCSTTSNTVTDTTTTTVAGQVRLEKTQAIDADCNGAAEGSFLADPLTAKPGACIIYKITATNEGLQNVTDLKIEDSLPAFTSRFPTTSNPLCTTGTAAYTGTVFSCGSAITLAPAASATMTFSVKIDQ